MSDHRDQLGDAYKLTNPAEAQDFYQGWAEGYEAEVALNEYITPQRCAEALARHAAAPWAPLRPISLSVMAFSRAER